MPRPAELEGVLRSSVGETSTAGATYSELGLARLESLAKPRARWVARLGRRTRLPATHSGVGADAKNYACSGTAVRRRACDCRLRTTDC